MQRFVLVSSIGIKQIQYNYIEQFYFSFANISFVKFFLMPIQHFPLVKNLHHTVVGSTLIKSSHIYDVALDYLDH